MTVSVKAALVLGLGLGALIHPAIDITLRLLDGSGLLYPKEG